MTTSSTSTQMTDTEQTGAQSGTQGKYHCANCGTVMTDAYCPKCGQADRHFVKFFPAVMREMVEDTLDLDGRFLRTMLVMLFKPGRITSSFLHGKRVYFSPPFRLYLFTSVVAFLIFSLQLGDFNVSVDTEPPEIANQPAQQNPVTTDSGTAPADAEAPATPATDIDGFNIELNGASWHYQDNPIDIGWLPAMADRYINNLLHSIEINFPRIKQNPGLLVKQTMQILPTTLFVLLPLFALIMKVFYLFAGRYYMEHLIFSIHVHTAMLIMMTLVALIEVIGELLPAGFQFSVGLVQVVIFLWAPLYMLLAQKHVYQQGWILTTIKYMTVYTIYSILQAFAVLVAVILGAANV